MKASSRHISIDGDYKPPSANRWTPEDDLAQALFAPPPIEEPNDSGILLATIELCFIILLVVIAPLAIALLLAK